MENSDTTLAIADATERLEELMERYHDDATVAHKKADAILLELLRQLGADEVALMYNKVDEFLGFEYGSTDRGLSEDAYWWSK